MCGLCCRCQTGTRSLRSAHRLSQQSRKHNFFFFYEFLRKKNSFQWGIDTNNQRFRGVYNLSSNWKPMCVFLSLNHTHSGLGFVFGVFDNKALSTKLHRMFEHQLIVQHTQDPVTKDLFSFRTCYLWQQALNKRWKEAENASCSYPTHARPRDKAENWFKISGTIAIWGWACKRPFAKIANWFVAAPCMQFSFFVPAANRFSSLQDGKQQFTFAFFPNTHFCFERKTSWRTMKSHLFWKYPCFYACSLRQEKSNSL